DHKSGLIEIRVEQGTAEPFFTHLFKGCVLFESLLKANTKNTPTAKLLGSILGELKDDLGFAAKPNNRDRGSDSAKFPVMGNAAMSSPSTKTAQYGSWKSPITSELIVAQSITLSEVCLDGGHVYWLEGRPQEQGRYVVVRAGAD